MVIAPFINFSLLVVHLLCTHVPRASPFVSCLSATTCTSSHFSELVIILRFCMLLLCFSRAKLPSLSFRSVVRSGLGVLPLLACSLLYLWILHYCSPFAPSMRSGNHAEFSPSCFASLSRLPSLVDFVLLRRRSFRSSCSWLLLRIPCFLCPVVSCLPPMLIFIALACDLM